MNKGSENVARYGSTAVFWILLFPTIHLLLNTAIYGIAPATVDKDYRKEDGEGEISRKVLAEYHLNPLQKAGVVDSVTEKVNQLKIHKAGRKHRHHHGHHSLQEFWDQVYSARITADYRASSASNKGEFQFCGYSFGCCSRWFSFSNKYAKKWITDLNKEGVTEDDLELFEHDPHFWQQPRLWSHYFITFQSSGKYLIGFGKYAYTMCWKFWQLCKLTVGYWDQSLIENMEIKARCVKLDINSSDFDQKHGTMLSTVGLAHCKYDATHFCFIDPYRWQNQNLTMPKFSSSFVEQH